VKLLRAAARETMGCGASSATAARSEVRGRSRHVSVECVLRVCGGAARMTDPLIAEMHRHTRRCNAVGAATAALRFQGLRRAVDTLSVRTSTRCPQPMPTLELSMLLEPATLQAAILALSTV
jgi:hypothetical protein